MGKNKSNNQKDRWIDVSETNKNKILEYAKKRRAKGKYEKTIYGETTTLIKLARFLKKEFKYATEKNMKDFFSDKEIVRSPVSADLYATRIIAFYRWGQWQKEKIKRKQRPDIMDWYEHQTKNYKNKDYDKKAKWFIHRKECDKLILTSPNVQDKALWEVFYLTGARLDEVLSMKIKSFKELAQGCKLRVYGSNRTRSIQLCEIPHHLMRWLKEHPGRKKPEAELWLSHSNRTFNQPLAKVKSIEDRFKNTLKRAEIDRHLTPKCFRKTRATIIFGEKKLTDADHEDLKEEIFGKSTIPISREKFEKENKILIRKQQEQIDRLSEDILTLRGASVKKGIIAVEKDSLDSNEPGLPLTSLKKQYRKDRL
jgi:integrase